MDDTTSITALELTSMPMPEPTSSPVGKLRRWLRSCKNNVQEQNRDRLRRELAKEVFQAGNKRRSWWSMLLRRLRNW